MQRSAVHFQQACDIVRRGELGKVTFVCTWNYDNSSAEGIGNPPDSDPPAGLDWDMWLGPAPMRPFNRNRFGVDPKEFSFFRWFWDYAGGMMTDWGVHWLDIAQMTFDVPSYQERWLGNLGSAPQLRRLAIGAQDAILPHIAARRKKGPPTRWPAARGVLNRFGEEPSWRAANLGRSRLLAGSGRLKRRLRAELPAQ